MKMKLMRRMICIEMFHDLNLGPKYEPPKRMWRELGEPTFLYDVMVKQNDTACNGIRPQVRPSRVADQEKDTTGNEY